MFVIDNQTWHRFRDLLAKDRDFLLFRLGVTLSDFCTEVYFQENHNDEDTGQRKNYEIRHNTAL